MIKYQTLNLLVALLVISPVAILVAVVGGSAGCIIHLWYYYQRDRPKW